MSEQLLRTEYGVVVRSSRPGLLPFVLKSGESFAVFDAHGDIRPEEGGNLGVFHRGTRHVSRLELRIWGQLPLLLSSTVREDNCMLVAHMTNPDMEGTAGEGVEIPKGTLHVQRSSLLTPNACLQQVAISSFADVDITVPITIRFDADFRDIFEVRGMHRPRRGTCRRETRQTAVRLVYHGLDGRDRLSMLRLGSAVSPVSEDSFVFNASVPARQAVRICFCVDFRDPDEQHAPQERFDQALERAIGRFRQARQSAAHIYTSNEQFNQWLNRSFADVHLLCTDAPTGLYPYAGVPWFSTPFGRDGIITARELLIVEPQLARGVLGYLAERQATEEDPDRDAEPGKILHEARLGEMAALREIPFGRYYGSIDSTPLFIMLAGDYLRRSGDVEFIRSIWPNLVAAAEWLRVWGDSDGDGLIEYIRHADTGLRNQGWKDSEDAISHADGRLAEGAISVCEVQAYAYAALRAIGMIASTLSQEDAAAEYERQAEQIRARFEETFWRPDLGTYALALDGQKRPCDVRSSNTGHALWGGIVSEEHAQGVVNELMAPSTFNGWGVRTLDGREALYNPMSYHNGSIWPHDNAIIALGMARYGFKSEAMRVMTGLFDASMFMPMHRLPELFCGFARREDEGPTLYPVACLPQAWASGAVFALIEAATGISLSVDGTSGRPMIRFTNPVLPPYLQHVRMTNLRVGEEEVDLELHRYDTGVGVQMVRRSPRIKVVITK